MSDKKGMRVGAADGADVDVAAAKRQAFAMASRQAKAAGHTPEDIRTIAMSAAVATEQALKRAAQSAASASAASGSDRAPPTKRRKSANRSGGDLNSQEQSAPRHASATSDAASGGSSTSTPTIYLDLTAPVPDNGDTPMAPSTARSAPAFVIRAPLVPGFWLGPRVDASPHALGALSPASREAASMRSMHTGFMEPSLLVLAALSLGVFSVSFHLVTLIISLPSLPRLDTDGEPLLALPDGGRRRGGSPFSGAHRGGAGGALPVCTHAC